MKIAVHLARHRRLVALGGLSLLLHLLAFAWIDALVAPPPPRIGAPIALRLVHKQAAAQKTVAAQSAQAQPQAALAPPLAHASGQARPALPPMRPLLPASIPAPGAADPAAPTHASAAPGIAPLQMPGRYRVRPPPSSRLSYAVTRTLPGRPAVAGEAAQLDWEYGGGAYRLRLDGVLGRLESEGGEDDAGIAPSQASEAGGGGAGLTRFNREQGRIEHGALAASEPLNLGSQDRASVLMQLAGIGLAEPDQMQDTLEIVVAGTGGARIARWQVVGKEQLATPAGLLATVRLAQLAPAGEARVEVWLAPERSWLPVQLRVTQADGSVANQVLTQMETDAAPL
jgi:hypothetical protein